MTESSPPTEERIDELSIGDLEAEAAGRKLAGRRRRLDAPAAGAVYNQEKMSRSDFRKRQVPLPLDFSVAGTKEGSFTGDPDAAFDPEAWLPPGRVSAQKNSPVSAPFTKSAKGIEASLDPPTSAVILAGSLTSSRTIGRSLQGG